MNNPPVIDWLNSPVPNVENAIALVVQGDAMTSHTGPDSFTDGSVIFVDTAREAKPGDMVVLTDNGESLFRKLVVEGSRRYLKALNPAWPDAIVQMGEQHKIVGVVYFAGKMR